MDGYCDVIQLSRTKNITVLKMGSLGSFAPKCQTDLNMPLRSSCLLGCFSALFLSPFGVAFRFSDIWNLHLTSGGYENHFWRSNITAVQVLFTCPNVSDRPQHFVAATPAANSGALSCFLPLNSSKQLSVQLVKNYLQNATGCFNNVGVQGRMTFSTDATLGVTVLGAVRAMRD